MEHTTANLSLGTSLPQSQETISSEELLMISLLCISHLLMDQSNLPPILSSTPIPIRISITSMLSMFPAQRRQSPSLQDRAITLRPTISTWLDQEHSECQFKFQTKTKPSSGKPTQFKSSPLTTQMIPRY